MSDKVSMRFLKDSPPYNSGEVAGFPLEKARKLWDKRTARPETTEDADRLNSGTSVEGAAGGEPSDEAPDVMQLIAENAVLQHEVRTLREQLAAGVSFQSSGAGDMISGEGTSSAAASNADTMGGPEAKGGFDGGEAPRDSGAAADGAGDVAQPDGTASGADASQGSAAGASGEGANGDQADPAAAEKEPAGGEAGSRRRRSNR